MPREYSDSAIMSGAGDHAPRVSVVTGFYNRAHVLRRTIESILKQTYEDFELIVFDDCSTDDTSKVLADLTKEFNDPRIVVIRHETNKGFVKGLSDAIATSRGEYIAIQGSGDESLARRLERQVELLDSRPEVGVVGSWYYNVQEDQGTRRLRQPQAESFSYEDLLKTNTYSHGEVMIRRSVYDAVGGYRHAFNYSQDRDLWLRIAKRATLATVEEPLYNRYIMFDGVSYVPEKMIRQACFSIAASRLAVMPPDDEKIAYEQIVATGIEAFLPPSDPAVQKRLFPAAVRMIVFGSPEAGRHLAKIGMKSFWRRGVIYPLAWIYRSRLKPLASRLIGLVTRIETR